MRVVVGDLGSLPIPATSTFIVRVSGGSTVSGPRLCCAPLRELLTFSIGAKGQSKSAACSPPMPTAQQPYASSFDFYNNSTERGS
jgi:hypothetical protein